MEQEISYYLLFILEHGTNRVIDFVPFKFKEDSIIITIEDKEYTGVPENVRQECMKLGYDSIIFERKIYLVFNFLYI